MIRRAAFLLLPAVLATACSRTTITAPSEDGTAVGMVVTGVGRVEASPDTLVVSMGVSSERDTAAEVLERVNRGARAMLAAIKRAGVEERDIQTTGLTVQPRLRASGPNRGEIIGFRGAETFRVKIRDLDDAGRAVGAGVDAAGDDARVSRMSLEIADPESAKQEARRKAVEDARRRAQEVAEAAGVRLGPPISIEESEATIPRPSLVTLGGAEFAGVPAPAGAGAARAVAGAVAQIEAGIQEVVVRVQVRFRILQ